MATGAASTERGATTTWIVGAWTTGGNLSDAVVKLQATGVSPKFSFGCGSSDGTATCDLGAIDATSQQRQLQAQTTVPVAAASVKSVTLTVVGVASGLVQDPTASATAKISGSTAASPSSSATTSPSSTASATTTPTPATTVTPITPITTTSPLPIGNLPGVTTGTSPSLSPGGNAGNLFPTLQPSSGSSAPNTLRGRPVANVSALPEGSSVVGASLIGLAALALAFVLAVTRLSIRRRPAPNPRGTAASAAAAGTPDPKDPPATPDAVPPAPPADPPANGAPPPAA